VAFLSSGGGHKVKVCIDPGHGGEDSGAVGPGKVKEADINLAVALLLARQLEAENGIDVIMTRKAMPPSAKLTTWERAKISNEAKAGLYVSLHCNAMVGGKAKGIEIWYYETSKRGEALASAILKHIASLGTANRGVKKGRFSVIKNTDCPACLVEMGFITNYQDLTLLTNPDYQLSMAKGIASGIKAYIASQHRGGG
jgi:N-acetylmuramoyl-L-alanine amidase